MKKKILCIGILSGLALVGCGKDNATVHEGEASYVEIVDDTNTSNDTQTSETQENSIDEGKVLTINYLDDTIPGGSYYFEFNSRTKILTMQVEHYSSVADASSSNSTKNIVINDEESIPYIEKAFELVNNNSEWSYSICSILEDMEDIITNSVEVTKEDVGDSLWESLYNFYDTNNDGVVTYKEDFFKIINEAYNGE